MISSGMFVGMTMVGDFASQSGGLFMFLSVAVVSSLSFVSIAVWTEARRKEREAYYKADSLRRIAEMPGEAALQVVEMMKEEARFRQMRALENEEKKLGGMKLGGLVNIAVGVALMLLIGGTSHTSGAYLVGLIPGLIGVALLVYALFLAPKHAQA